MNIVNKLKLNQIGLDKVDGRVYQVLIDDVPLLQMFKEYELQFDDKINGAYTDALSEIDVRNALQQVSGRFMPLGCDCGVSECWFVTGQVLNIDQYVCWGQWINPYRNQRKRKAEGLFWNYKEFPAIVFEANQYRAAIKHALE